MVCLVYGEKLVQKAYIPAQERIQLKCKCEGEIGDKIYFVLNNALRVQFRMELIMIIVKIIAGRISQVQKKR